MSGCWLCEKPGIMGRANPFLDNTKLCTECSEAVNEIFDLERPSAARLFHIVEQRIHLPPLELEEKWLNWKLDLLERISNAAHVEAEQDQLLQRKSQLKKDWKESPPRRHLLAALHAVEEDDNLLALQVELNEASLVCLDRAIYAALSYRHQLCSLHVLEALMLQNDPENVANTVLLLSDFKGRAEWKALTSAMPQTLLETSDDGTSSVPLVSEELSKSLADFLENVDPDRRIEGHTGFLLGAILREDSLAYQFLKERCRIEQLVEHLERV